jgi:hypothetical protein
LPENSERADSAFKAVIDHPLFPEEERERCKGVYDKYFPMERDPSIPHKEKIDLMREWWECNFEIFTK